METEKGWVRARIPDSIDFHVLPRNDIQEHAPFGTCPCGPEIEREKVNGKIIARAIVHKAFDGRPGPLA